jgi:hypothetical protein
MLRQAVAGQGDAKKSVIIASPIILPAYIVCSVKDNLCMVCLELVCLRIFFQPVPGMAGACCN